MTVAVRSLEEVVADDQHAKVIDFNVHDLAGIRLLNPGPRDIRSVEDHLGFSPAPFAGQPALTIRFVDKIPLGEPLRFLGREDVGFTGDAFIVLRSRTLARARARLAMETIGQSCDILCETGQAAVPLLRPLLNLVLLARGIVPVHAAAFCYKGHGVMVTGWSHGSKTGTLLAFMAAGASFVGDEWIYLDARRDRMVGLPDHLEARPWYLRELPEYQRRVGAKDRLRVGLASRLAAVIAPLNARSERGTSLTSKLVRFAHQALVDQQSISLRPPALFGTSACPLEARLDTVIMTVSRDSPTIDLQPTPTDHIARQMAASFLHEQASLTNCYLKHLFAFPDRRNPLLDDLETVYRQQAARALEGKAGFTMLHPYPVSVAALRGAVEPLLPS